MDNLERAYSCLWEAIGRTQYTVGVVDVGNGTFLPGSDVHNVAETDFDNKTITIASFVEDDPESLVCVLAHELAHVFDPDWKSISHKQSALWDIEAYHHSKTPEGMMYYGGKGPVTYSQYKFAQRRVQTITAEQEIVAQTAAMEFCWAFGIDIREQTRRYLQNYAALTKMTRRLRRRTDTAVARLLGHS